MQEDYSQFVPDVTFEKIPIKNLVSNQAYQRNISHIHVSRTADNFNLRQINPVKVSRRDGINYVFNGQHTAETVARVSGSRDTPVWCMVYHDLSYGEEADIFAQQQKYTKALSPYEIFMANIEAENEVQLTIKSLVESFGLTLSSSYKAPGAICAISALEFIFNKYGVKALEDTLYLAVATWQGDSFSLAANMLKGIAKLIVSYGELLKFDLFVERLSRVSAKEVTRNAKERRNGSLGFAEVLLQTYNKRTKYPLRMNKLYNAKEDSDYELEEPDQEQDQEENYEGALPEHDGNPDQLSFNSFVDQDDPDEE